MVLCGISSITCDFKKVFNIVFRSVYLLHGLNFLVRLRTTKTEAASVHRKPEKSKNDELQESENFLPDDFKHWEPSDENRELISVRKKYVVGEILGRGVYGTVVRGWENGEEDKPVAIKVAKGAKGVKAMIEAINLSKIRRCEGANEYLIRMTDVFISTDNADKRISRTCIVLELMEISLQQYMYKVMGKEEYMSLSQIRHVLRDVLNGLAKLKQMGMVHADLKLDNIMLNGCESVQTLRAKIIDFGSAHLVSQQDAIPRVQVLYYRSPEVIMHCVPYSEAIDMWSVGCILGELLVKRTLYPGKCGYDQLRYIVDNQGLPSRNLMRQGLRSAVYFNEKESLPWDFDHNFRLKTPQEFLSTCKLASGKLFPEDKVIYESSHGRKHDKKRTNSFPKIASISIPKQFSGDNLRTEVADRGAVIHLLECLLTWDPKQRIRPEKALQLPFFDLTHLRRCKGQLRERKYEFNGMSVPIDPAPYQTSVTGGEAQNEEEETPQEITGTNTDASTEQQQQQPQQEQPTKYITDQQFLGEHMYGFDSPGVRARALCSYHMNTRGIISLEPGDVVSNINQLDEELWEGLAPSGYFGLFPAKYVELIE